MNIFDIKFLKDKKFYNQHDEFIIGKQYKIHSMDKVNLGWHTGDIVTYTIIHENYPVFMDSLKKWISQYKLKEYHIILTDLE